MLAQTETPYTKQGRQCTYDATLRGVRATISAVEKPMSGTQHEYVYSDTSANE